SCGSACTATAAAAPARRAEASTPMRSALSSCFVLRSDRQGNRLLPACREIERLREHQAVVRFGGGGVLGRETERNPIEPLLGLFAHRPAQLAERDVARRITAEEIHAPPRIGRIALALRLRRREHDV